MAEVACTLRSGAACRIFDPATQRDTATRIGVVALHPWSALGGSMHDPHVLAVVRYFSGIGCATARVNFRTGFSCGSSPIADAEDAAFELMHRCSVDRVVMCGYSYGSVVAMSAASAIPEALGWCAVNPPLDYAWALFLGAGGRLLEDARDPSRPKLVVHGTNDQFCSNDTFDAFYAELPEPKAQLQIEGAHHFNVFTHLEGAFDTWLRTSFGCTPDAFARGDFDRFEIIMPAVVDEPGPSRRMSPRLSSSE